MRYAPLKSVLLACGILVALGLTAVPLMHHLHAAPASKRAASGSPGGSATAPRSNPPEKPLDRFHRLHNFLVGLLPWDVTGRGEEFVSAADDKKDEKEKTLSGVWVKKDGEMKIEFDGKEMKLYPHGENKIIVVLCEQSLGKDGVVKAKITGFDGKDDAKKKFEELIPVGTEFRFKWAVNKGTATISDLKDDKEKVERLKSHLEGDFEKK